MVVRHMNERHELMREHVLQQNELLARLMEDAQKEQMAELKARQDK